MTLKSPPVPYNLDLPSLPINEVLGDIQQALVTGNEAIVEAPPGAGKTTLVPLALLNEPWLGQQRILMLEPRRMAARAAAQRMASLLGEKVGATVGFRVRQESRVSDQTRIEVITEGILNRLLLDDPSLEHIALIIFDEFHERSLDADLGLALALEGRALFRDSDNPLKLMLMSATLNGEALQQLLPQAPIIRSAGKMFPVQTVYGKPYRQDDNLIDRTVATIKQALTDDTGNLLVFLPGQREIVRTAETLRQQLPEHIQVRPLYGAQSLAEQQQAIDPPVTGQRKIVLATDIAETSLTIEGITIVIDSGLCRQPQFDLNSGMTRLHTRRISQDSSTQRRGRAGRLEAGRCYRLWSEEQQQQLSPFRSPEILQADLAPLLLQLITWGIDDIDDLTWLDRPTNAAIQQALGLLLQLGAINQQTQTPEQPLSDWCLTAHGKTMNQLPVHPRLAHMLLVAANYQLSETACALATLLTDKHPFGREAGADLYYPLSILLGENRCDKKHQGWLQRSKKQSAQFLRLIQQADRPSAASDKAASTSINHQQAAGFLVANAYPERIAQRSAAQPDEYRLANGQKAFLVDDDPLMASDWLAVAEIGGIKRAGQTHNRLQIFSASHFDAQLLETALADQVEVIDHLEWDLANDRFVAEQRHRLGKLTLKSSPLPNPSAEIISKAVLQQIQQRGIDLLPWDESCRQWQARVQLLYRLNTDASPAWPDVSDQALRNTLSQWLAPYLTQVRKLSDLKKLDLISILSNLLPWPLPKQLDEQCPVTLTVPSGSNIRIDYCADPPVLKVKLQEMFGCTETPSVANGKMKLMLHLLSPAQRPLQVTQDLAGFWQGSYFDVQKDMKGRYPKHPWPDNPLQSQATRFTKKKLT